MPSTPASRKKVRSTQVAAAQNRVATMGEVVAQLVEGFEEIQAEDEKVVKAQADAAEAKATIMAGLKPVLDELAGFGLKDDVIATLAGLGASDIAAIRKTIKPAKPVPSARPVVEQSTVIGAI